MQKMVLRTQNCLKISYIVVYADISIDKDNADISMNTPISTFNFDGLSPVLKGTIRRNKALG